MIDWLENFVNKCAKSSKMCIKMVSVGKGCVYLEGVYSRGIIGGLKCYQLGGLIFRLLRYLMLQAGNAACKEI